MRNPPYPVGLTGTLLSLALTACPGPAPATTPPPDTTPPTIRSSAPTDGAVGVSTGTGLALVFSEGMDRTSLRVTASPAATLGPATWGDERTVAFTPPAGWQSGTAYAVEVGGKDLAGNALDGTKTIRFSTLAAPDTAPPGAPTGLSPTALDGGFRLTWTANPEPDLAGYTLFFGTAADALGGALFIEQPSAPGQPSALVSGLENGRAYFFAVEAQDTSGNRSARSAVGSVTPRDTTAPALVSSEPAGGAQNLSLVPPLRLSFSEPMNTALEIGGCVTTEPPATATCPNPSLRDLGQPTWSEGDTVASFPARPFESGKTHVLVVLGRDKADNPLPAQTRLAFSVRAAPDSTAPSVTASRGLPVSDPAPRASFEMTFSEPMNQQSVQSATLTQPALGCAWTWQGNTATCAVTSGLVQSTTYTVTLGTGAADLAGNRLQAAHQFSFLTGNFPPRVVAASPRSGAMNVSSLTPIVLTFSEPMAQAATRAALEVKVGASVKAGTLGWNADSTQLMFTPTTAYGYGQVVTWKLRTSATDAGGKPMATEATGSFQTQLVVALGAATRP